MTTTTLRSPIEPATLDKRSGRDRKAMFGVPLPGDRGQVEKALGDVRSGPASAIPSAELWAGAAGFASRVAMFAARRRQPSIPNWVRRPVARSPLRFG
jgi:hypothetical protein